MTEKQGYGPEETPPQHENRCLLKEAASLQRVDRVRHSQPTHLCPWRNQPVVVSWTLNSLGQVGPLFHLLYPWYFFQLQWFTRNPPDPFAVNRSYKGFSSFLTPSLFFLPIPLHFTRLIEGRSLLESPNYPFGRWWSDVEFLCRRQNGLAWLHFGYQTLSSLSH